MGTTLSSVLHHGPVFPDQFSFSLPVFYTSITIFPLYTLRSWWKDSFLIISPAISTKRQSGQSLQSHISPSQQRSSTSATSHSAWKATLLNGNISTGCQHGESPIQTLQTRSPATSTNIANQTRFSCVGGGVRKARWVIPTVCECVSVYFGSKNLFVCPFYCLLFLFGYCVCVESYVRVCGHFSHLEKGIYLAIRT